MWWHSPLGVAARLTDAGFTVVFRPPDPDRTEASEQAYVVAQRTGDRAVGRGAVATTGPST
ncbi:hypothetical protein SAMN05443637_115155 [Pseudonocardia thermophila]|uniref:Uncharacterized protein n=1 Tax=Pseudonocardia thermophila TaxID=1848 RepID=A0A1M6WX17_PSETH|nr:hypothetical protein [Pseudonocardia thermophila]SHK98191.1 hypothetical protein SAMN05443637_115155 [Pseudonocardia thermophila]